MHSNEKEQDLVDSFAEEVKKIEAEAEDIIKDANLKKEQMISDAKSESAALIIKRHGELEHKKEEYVKRQKEKIDKEKEDKLEQDKKNLINFEKNSKKNIPKAVEFVIKALDKDIEEL